MHDTMARVDLTALRSAALRSALGSLVELHGHMVKVLAVWLQLQSALLCDARDPCPAV